MYRFIVLIIFLRLCNNINKQIKIKQKENNWKR